MRRRDFLTGLAAGSLIAGARLDAAGRVQSADVDMFCHGVASGDPTPEGMVLWTRLNPNLVSGVREVRWQLSDMPDMSRCVRSGNTVTGPERDWTIKVSVHDLAPGRDWFYQFEYGEIRSAVGRTRTLAAEGLRPVNLAIVSCSNFPAGFFHAYTDILRDPDIDAVVHLGDYIYEYGMGEYATSHARSLGRVPDPIHETVRLADYRRRYAQYRSDAALRLLHTHLPMIAVWDDHETANDAWLGGAQNHQAEEGDWCERRAAALKAYDEWMPVTPIRDNPPRRYRRYGFGEVADLFLLDTRLAGRERQVAAPSSKDDFERFRAELSDPARTLLGSRQERWLAGEIAASRGRWQVVAQQILVAPMITPDLRPVIDLEGPSSLPPERLAKIVENSALGLPLLLDTWDGYPAARGRLLGSLHRARNPVVLSGDLHIGIDTNIPAEDGRNAVPEFVTPAVSSPGLGLSLPAREPGGLEAAFRRKNPQVDYVDMRGNGWLRVTLEEDRCVAQWRNVSSVLEPAYTTITAHRRIVEAKA